MVIQCDGICDGDSSQCEWGTNVTIPLHWDFWDSCRRFVWEGFLYDYSDSDGLREESDIAVIKAGAPKLSSNSQQG